MSKQIDNLKKLKYKYNRMKGNSIAKSLINAGAPETTAYHDSKNLKLVKICEEELRKELMEEDVTVKLIINNLNEDRSLAKAKGDIATMKECDVWLGKYLAMFTDKVKNEGNQQTQIIVIKSQEEENAANRISINTKTVEGV